jgi:hypothetical protein
MNRFGGGPEMVTARYTGICVWDSGANWAGSGGLLRVLRPRAVDTLGYPLHLVFAVELHFFELDFFDEVFGVEVGGPGDALQFCFVLLVLFRQTLIFGVCFENYVPRCPRESCHAFLLMTEICEWSVTHIAER